jgi:phage baseplate assembly protein W
MAFYAPELPLQRDSKMGYKMIETFKNTVKQNFKMLILTVPGERVMIPDFGVGLYQFLFEPVPTAELQEKIRARILDQVEIYLPLVSIKDISFFYDDSPSPTSEPNTLQVRVQYYIKTLNQNDTLEINAGTNF